MPKICALARTCNKYAHQEREKNTQMMKLNTFTKGRICSIISLEVLNNCLSSSYFVKQMKYCVNETLQPQIKLNPNDCWVKTSEACRHVIMHAPTYQCCHLLHQNICPVIQLSDRILQAGQLSFQFPTQGTEPQGQ